MVDHESWIMNLKEANLYDFPIYYKLYSARAAYNMKGLRPVDWDELVVNMTDDKERFDLYYKYEILKKTFKLILSNTETLTSGITIKILRFDRRVMQIVESESYVIQKVDAVMTVNFFVRRLSLR